ncbi:hypothetical protein [Neptuniibacter sp. QD37_11]|uniref:hypothetical protein n=1 Tax=Neptuniibacter sp. QD37_11 TaxID=3398209 RepID=UPI0039F57100
MLVPHLTPGESGIILFADIFELQQYRMFLQDVIQANMEEVFIPLSAMILGRIEEAMSESPAYSEDLVIADQVYKLKGFYLSHIEWLIALRNLRQITEPESADPFYLSLLLRIESVFNGAWIDMYGANVKAIQDAMTFIEAAQDKHLSSVIDTRIAYLLMLPANKRKNNLKALLLSLHQDYNDFYAQLSSKGKGQNLINPEAFTSISLSEIPADISL